MSQSMKSAPKRHKRSLKLLFVVPTGRPFPWQSSPGAPSDPAEPTADATPETTTSGNTSQTSPDGSSATTNQATGQEQLPAAKPGTPVEKLGNGVSINATSVTRTNISRTRTGQRSGGQPIAVTFAVSTDSGRSIDLDTAFNANLVLRMKIRTPAEPSAERRLPVRR